MEKLIETALEMIKPQMTVSFGGGRTVGRLIQAVKDEKLDIRVASPSEVTHKLCKDLDLSFVSIEDVDKFDLAFDGCDSLDFNLNALKSNGGIHTLEKLYANLAQEYIIMAPKTRYTRILSPKVQLTLEVLDLAIPQVITEVQKLGGQAKIRQSQDMAGMVRTVNGNGLVDCNFNDWSQIDEIDLRLSRMTGVVGTSYFKNLISRALLSTEEGVEQIIKK